MKNLVFSKWDRDGMDDCDLYHYEDPDNPRVLGDIGCSETDLCLEFCRVMEIAMEYQRMMFVAAEERPDLFNAESALAMAEQWFDHQTKRIKGIFEILEKKAEKINILESREGNSDVEKNRVVAVYFGELEKFDTKKLGIRAAREDESNGRHSQKGTQGIR